MYQKRGNMEKKQETFTYNDLGFPIRLINFPMKKVFGEWMLDVNLSKFHRHILQILIYKPIPISKRELKFIRKYFEMTTTEFGKALGITHAAVLKWESGENKIPATADFYVRVYSLKLLQAKNNEISKLVDTVNPEILKQHQNDIERPIEIEDSEKYLLC